MELSNVKAYLEEHGARLHHIGILSENLEGTIDFFKNLPYINGLEANPGDYFPVEKLIVGEPFFIRITNGIISNNPIRMEILQPVREKSDPRNIYSVLLDKHGPGFHHIAYAVSEKPVYEEAVASFVEAGYKIILRGSEFVYLDPEDGSGCFLEFLCIPPDR